MSASPHLPSKLVAAQHAAPLQSLRPVRGFTAVEISMVVTVIAILAMLILPLFSRQVEEGRITAAESDIRMFATAMQLANANTGYYFTLSSLDNTENYDTATIDATLDIPVVTWNDALTPDQRTAVADNWDGPYSSVRRSITPVELEALQPGVWFRGGAIGGTTSAGAGDGPINQQYDPAIGAVNFSNDRIPLDPWGTPYLYYGPDLYHLPPSVVANESRFRNALFVSLGPDSLPGAGNALTPANLTREILSGLIQDPNSDDIYRYF